MALHWHVGKIENFKELCWVPAKYGMRGLLLTPDDVHRHIGLATNASTITEPVFLRRTRPEAAKAPSHRMGRDHSCGMDAGLGTAPEQQRLIPGTKHQARKNIRPQRRSTATARQQTA